MTSEKLHADVVVVGSGVSGGLVGALAARAGKSVIILEAGPRVKRHDIVETYRNAPVKLSLANMKLQGAGSPYPSMPYAPSTYGDYLEQLGPVPFKTSYLRVVGGTTWHFGSALWRLIPNDFRLQTLYGRGRDWPISYADLEPYYCRAEEELGVSGVDGQDEGGNGGHISAAFKALSYVRFTSAIFFPTLARTTASRWLSPCLRAQRACDASLWSTACMCG